MDCSDGCPADPDKTAPGICGCSTPDTDTDADGTPDCNDACLSDPAKTEPGQCGCGNPETDSDNDGTADCNDGCPNDPDKVERGLCGCGVADTDSDGDGTPNCNEKGNIDGDADVDLDDFRELVLCMGGPNGLLPACEAADFNEDGVADLADVAVIQQNFTGSNP